MVKDTRQALCSLLSSSDVAQRLQNVASELESRSRKLVSQQTDNIQQIWIKYDRYPNSHYPNDQEATGVLKNLAFPIYMGNINPPTS